MIFTISARGKLRDASILEFLKSNYSSIPMQKIDSVFGFLESSSLYGGRIFTEPELTDSDVEELYSEKCF